jgi:hypothetical protein
VDIVDEPTPDRVFDNAEAEQILLDAARADDARDRERAAVPSLLASDGLTLREIQRAAAAVGITPGAVAAASVRMVLRDAHAASSRAHATHTIDGELSRAATERIADEIRTTIDGAVVRVTSDGIDAEVGKPEGQRGSLLVKIRSRDGATTLSVWSVAPALSGSELAGLGTLGIPLALFPVVAASGGSWPAIGTALALGAGGLLAATGLSAAGNRWRVDRWRARAEDAATSIAGSVATHVVTTEPPTDDTPPDSAER